jgi:hypothetical protein
MAFKSVLSTLFCVTFLAVLIGCGSLNQNPSVVHASSPAVPDVGPDFSNCGVSDDGMACSFVTHVKDKNGNVLFYCQGETHVFDVTKTYSWHLEVGISSLISDPNLSGCTIPMPESFTALNMRGNLALKPWTGNLTSIATWTYGIDGTHKAVLHTSKIQADKGLPTAITLETGDGAPLTYQNGGHFIDGGLLFWFNIDLPNSVPATISATGSGEIQ